MTRSPRRRMMASSLGRAVALMGLGMASVLVPAFAYVHIETIRNLLPSIEAIAEMFEGDPDPSLVTFGPLARVNEGDHDFRQLIRFSLPQEAGKVHVRVFDADVGGAYDEAKGGFDTSTRFSLFGGGAAAKLDRDGSGVLQENVEGKPLGTVSLAGDDASDGHWTTLFATDAGKGSAAAI